jgi:hypothetical protein
VAGLTSGTGREAGQPEKYYEEVSAFADLIRPWGSYELTHSINF